MHIFTQSGWLILFNPDHFSGLHQIGESPPNTFSSSELFKKASRHTVRSSIAASRHNQESLLIYGPLASILLDQGIPVEYELDEFNPPHTGTTLSRLQLWQCRLRRKIPLRQPAISSLANLFWRHSRFSPQTTRTMHSRATTSFLSLTSKHDLCCTYGDHTSLTHSTMP